MSVLFMTIRLALRRSGETHAAALKCLGLSSEW